MLKGSFPFDVVRSNPINNLMLPLDRVEKAEIPYTENSDN